MIFLLKVWAFIKKYWQAFVGLLILMVGVILGTSGKQTKVLEKDKEALKKQNKDFQEGAESAIFKNQKDREEALSKRDEQHRKIDTDSKAREEELKNNTKKLDEELKDTYNLKKG